MSEIRRSGDEISSQFLLTDDSDSSARTVETGHFTRQVNSTVERRARGRMDPLDINRDRVRQYWESYERSLNGGEWRISTVQEFGLAWSDTIQIILEVTLCILIAILLMVIYYCFAKKKKLHTMDTESMWVDPPTYDEFELENLKDLPSYQDAVRQENEKKTKY